MGNLTNDLNSKTKILNVLRKIFMSCSGEHLLRKYTKGKNSTSFISKFVPNYYQYQPYSMRFASNKDGIKFQLDISDIIDWFIFFGFKESSKEILIDAAKGSSLILDVGANVGEISLKLALAKNCTIHSFEPDPVNFERFTQNLNLNNFENINLHKIGLGDKNGSAILSTETVFNRGRNKISACETDNSVFIEITTIDNFLEKQEISHVDFIKIDVEGYEYNVLLGAKQTILKYRPTLFIELDDSNLKRQKSSAKILIKYLKQYGYEIKNTINGASVSVDSNFDNCHFDILAIPI